MLPTICYLQYATYNMLPTICYLQYATYNIKVLELQMFAQIIVGLSNFKSHSVITVGSSYTVTKIFEKIIHSLLNYKLYLSKICYSAVFCRLSFAIELFNTTISICLRN